MASERREVPSTEEGWYALHDFRRIDWDAWRDAPDSKRERALEEGIEYLESHEQLEDASEGTSVVFSILGHKADFMMMHLRPTPEHIDRAERRFESTAFAEFTERTTSYVSVTEASGYTHDISDGIENIDDPGMRNYMQQRLYPSIPDADYVCFYPMDKRREPEQNWYDLPFDERAEHMSSHGEIGRDYAGSVVQMITGSIGLDDYEWGVTLFAEDLVSVKDLLYEMRFDPSTSKFAEFGPFYVGRRFPPEDLEALLAGEAVPSGEALEEEGDEAQATDEGEDQDDDETGAGGPPDADEAPHDEVAPGEFVPEVRRFGVDLGEHDAGYGLLFYSEADAEELHEEVDGLRGNFDHYDTHVLTTVRAEAGESGVVSLWANERAADIASGFLSDLPGVTGGIGAPLEGADDDAEADEASDAHGTDETGSVREELEDLDIYAGQPHGEDVYAMVLYSEADAGDLFADLDELRERFETYDSHVTSAVYSTDAGDRSAVVSIWESRTAAERAGDALSDLPGIVARAGEESGFGTMGMFYTVKPEYREEFRETFEDVGEMLEGMDGHLETRLLENHEDENDMFIASQWRDRDDAMEFFRSDAFRDTVEWGREVLADRPRHVFLA